MDRIEVPVLIVGGGPTGLTGGMLLAQHGLGHHIVERRPGPQRAPAAHVTNARTFEVWRQAGADMDDILATAKDPRDAGSVLWVTKLGGEVLGRLPFERQGDDVLDLTPTPLRNLSQHNIEPALNRQLRRNGGATVSYQHQWQSAVTDASGVTSQIRDLATGREYEVRSRWLIAADGAGSPVRRSVGIQPIGPDRIQAFMMIHFEANLRAFVGDNRGVLYWVSDPECTGTFVAHDLDREWVFMQMWDPDRESASDFTPERCEAIVRKAMQRQDIPLSIRTIAPWMMTSQVAERYRDGRIFLAGDAAHRFPPTGGMGLNSGVQDIHNLVWKLAAVETGWADLRLLDSYEAERKPVAHYNAEQSFTNAMRMFEVPQAMGTAAEPADARRNFAAMLASDARRAEVRAAIERQAEHFDMLGLQLGFSYDSNVIVPDGSTPPVVANPVREFVPSSRPGSRLPHCWIERAGQRISTLDLIAADRFTLLAGPRGDDWIAAAASLDVPMQVVRIDQHLGGANEWWSSVAAMSDSGVLLVRPDQHVAFRAQVAAPSAAAALGAAVNAATAR